VDVVKVSLYRFFSNEYERPLLLEAGVFFKYYFTGFISLSFTITGATNDSFFLPAFCTFGGVGGNGGGGGAN
jgi:hypothetical protein